MVIHSWFIYGLHSRYFLCYLPCQFCSKSLTGFFCVAKSFFLFSFFRCRLFARCFLKKLIVRKGVGGNGLKFEGEVCIKRIGNEWRYIPFSVALFLLLYVGKVLFFFLYFIIIATLWPRSLVLFYTLSILSNFIGLIGHFVIDNAVFQALNFLFIPPMLRVVYIGVTTFVWLNVLCYIKSLPH